MIASSKISIEHIKSVECVICNEQNDSVISCPKCFHNGAICESCKKQLPKHGFKQYQCVTCKQIIDNDNAVNNEQHIISIDENNSERYAQNTAQNEQDKKCNYIMYIIISSWAFSILGYYLLAAIFNLKYKPDFFNNYYKAPIGLIGGFIIVMSMVCIYKLFKYAYKLYFKTDDT